MTKLAKSLCAIVVFVSATVFGGSAAIAQNGGSQQSGAQHTGWAISDADGQVSVIRDGKPIYGAKGTKLELGDLVRTSKAARAVLMRGKEFVVVPPGEQVRIAKAEEAGAVGQFIEFMGNILTSNGTESALKRPVGVAVVKGFDTTPGKRTKNAPEVQSVVPE
ncbi:MAG: hypothetical protein WBA51_13190 [Erythrobacter sp.]